MEIRRQEEGMGDRIVEMAMFGDPGLWEGQNEAH